MDEMNLDGQFSAVALIDENQKVYAYELTFALDGDSGVTVHGETQKECAENAVEYLMDYLQKAKDEFEKN